MKKNLSTILLQTLLIVAALGLCSCGESPGTSTQTSPQADTSAQGDSSSTSSDGDNQGSTVASESDTQAAASDTQSRTADLSYTRVSVHDPSIFKDGDTYYVFGSHRAWAKSTDLQNWETFTMNLNTEYSKMFKDLWDNYCKTANNPSVRGNMWAPDVIYNPEMKKYCMYMSINGSDYNSAIVLLTADKAEGPYDYVGPVVFSGFNSTTHPVAYTDVYKVLGKDAKIGRYQSTKNTKINAIDPCVKYDENGTLWMSFGSWFGGIFMLKLDPKTGLRDYGTTYETVANQSDAYYGYKLAGGHEVSGEGSYLMYSNGYYYLFMSYGGLTANGGYQIRLFRSKEITGPYVDEAGNSAIYTNAINDLAAPNGIRMMSSYAWSGSSEIRVAQGHNSALTDTDGKMYLVYHSRFVNRDEEHEIRVQQLFSNEDDWLITAPYEYAGESLSATPYSSAQIAGDYEFILHAQTTYYKGLGSKDSGIIPSVKITLKEDGTITGDGISGTWAQGKDSPQAELTIDGITYKGYFIEMPNEAEHKIVMTFTALGDNVCVYGSKTISNPE